MDVTSYRQGQAPRSEALASVHLPKGHLSELASSASCHQYSEDKAVRQGHHDAEVPCRDRMLEETPPDVALCSHSPSVWNPELSKHLHFINHSACGAWL